MKISHLRCEDLNDPPVMDELQPRLSWQLHSPDRGQIQTAYRILVAGTLEELASDRGDVWDSGRVESGASIQVAYAGQPLSSRQRCFWKVRIWDRTGVPSAWSAPASWRMGLLRPDDWSAVWIGADPAAGTAEFPWLRTVFELDGLPCDARVYVHSLGYHELYVNGVKVGDDVLSPAVTQLSRRSYYLAHDVTGLLRPGKNCVALWLGSGWYYYADYKGCALTEPVVGPAVRLQLELVEAGGVRRIIASGSDWRGAPSPITRQGKQRWSLCHDARADQPDWNRPGFDDRAWRSAQVRAITPHRVCAQMVEPNRVQRRFAPVRIDACGQAAWQVDFGTNLAGGLAVRFPGPLERGQTIQFEYFDRLVDEKGQPAKPVGQDAYIASGAGNEQFVTRLNYQGFRYVRIAGLANAPRLADAEAFLIHTDFEAGSSFACSNERLTAIHDMVCYTFRCLTLGGYMVDCPHIERLGYGGDGQASAESALMMYGLAPLYRSWLAAWRDCQEPNGDLPHTAPSCFAGGGPYWPGFVLVVSWLLYRQYGDRTILAENYPVVLKWLDFVETHCPDGGLMSLWPASEYRNWCLGDWAVPRGVDQKHEPSVRLITNCYRIVCYDVAARVAGALKRPEDAARFQAQAERLRPLVHAAFFDPAAGTYADGDQIDLAFPLLAGVTPPPLRAEVFHRLEMDILERQQGHLALGLVGVPVLVSLLTALERHDLLFTVVNQDSYPGWGYMLKNGATTTWEHWDGRRSHIHNCYNGIGAWFYQGLAGIRPDSASPGFGQFTVRPAVVGDVTWVTAVYSSIRGPITSQWRVTEHCFELTVIVPVGSTALVHLPLSAAAQGGPVEDGPCMTFLRIEDRRAVYAVASGRYDFRVEQPVW